MEILDGVCKDFEVGVVIVVGVVVGVGVVIVVECSQWCLLCSITTSVYTSFTLPPSLSPLLLPPPLPLSPSSSAIDYWKIMKNMLRDGGLNCEFGIHVRVCVCPMFYSIPIPDWIPYLIW